MKRVSSVAVVSKRDAILFIRRRDTKKWTMPGGHVEPGEEPLTAAVRELYEEAGIKVDPDDLDFLGSGIVGGRIEVFSYKVKDPQQEIVHDNDPDEEGDDHCWFDSDSEHEKGLPTNVHIPNDRNVTLILMGRSENAGSVKINEEMKKMAIKDLKIGEDDGEGAFDYSHLLPTTWKNKLSLKVKYRPNKDHQLHTYLEDADGEHVGNIQASIDKDNKSIEPHSDLHEDYHGEGLGRNMYEALYTHALNHHGINTVAGGKHTEAAGRVHESLARQHGLGYVKTKRNSYGAMSDMTRGPYEYSIKSEEDMKKGLLGAIAGMALAAGPSPKLSAAFDKVNPPAPKIEQVKAPTQPQEKTQFEAATSTIPKWTPEGLHSSLIPIAHLESSFGQNMIHAPHSQGEYHTAYGPVGLKPSTAHEEWNKSSKIKEKFPGLEDPAAFTKKFKNDWQFHNLVASSHFLRLQHRHGTPEKAVYAWRWGSTAAKRAPDSAIHKDKYVTSYRDLAASTGIKKAEKPKDWKFKDGITIPHSQNKVSRAKWDDGYKNKLIEAFAYGDTNRLRPVKIPVSEHISGHFVNTNGAVGKGRNRAPDYLKMLNGKDKLPPLVVRRNGISWHVVDGNARLHAALKHGNTKELDAYELIDPPSKLGKGLKGDWQSEGYQIRHEVSPDGKSVSMTAHLNGQKVGDMDAGHSQAEPGTLYPSMVNIHPEHQRKGLATEMYKRAEAVLGKPFKAGSYQSPEAKALWKQKNRPFGNRLK